MNRFRRASLVAVMSLAWPASPGFAQAPGAPAQGSGRGAQPQFVSHEVTDDRRITLRIYAPQAQSVRLNATDIPGVGAAASMTRGDNGVWEIVTGPLPPGTYRYAFNVDAVATIDPRNPSVSQSDNNAWSLVSVPGSAASDIQNVPHGSVAEVHYYSAPLGAFRRMHVYTPPGYETSNKKYPVFYLLHGAGDSDDSWSTVGRAGIILDNLIAAGKAKPMIVVMPAGHTRVQPAAQPLPDPSSDPFVNDFVAAVMPHVQKHYRTVSGRASTAIAGLSMGGSQTLNIAFENPSTFGYVGVYSSGLLGVFPIAGRGTPPPSGASGAIDWEARHAAALGDSRLKKGLRLFWFSTGSEDFLLQTTVATVEFFKEHGFMPIHKESAGGHTWLNWRDYLTEFAPMLFQ